MSDGERCGVVFGAAIGGIDRIDEGIQALRKHDYSKISPFTVPTGIPNFPAYLIARQFQCLGPNSTISTACAAGTQSIGEAAEFIRRGAADVILAGGAEAVIKDFTIGGFCAMRALPTNYNDRPEAASRPFDAKREGFVFSEGAGALIVESLEHAQQRGARIYAEVAGHASSADAVHMAQPDPDAHGPARAMRWALADAGLAPQAIDYINAHGSSTPLNDATETKAIKLVFGEHAYRPGNQLIEIDDWDTRWEAPALWKLSSACWRSLTDGSPPPSIMKPLTRIATWTTRQTMPANKC